MKKLISILLIFTIHQKSDSINSDKIYIYKLTNDAPEFIQLFNNRDNLKDGYYYGHQDFEGKPLYFIADIIIDKVDKEKIKFYITNYRFSKVAINPYLQLKDFLLEDEVPYFLKFKMTFFGNFDGEKLFLNRTKEYFDSKAENMIFVIEKSKAIF